MALADVTGFESLAGMGVCATLEGKQYCLGNRALMLRQSCDEKQLGFYDNENAVHTKWIEQNIDKYKKFIGSTEELAMSAQLAQLELDQSTSKNQSSSWQRALFWRNA